MNPNLPHNDNDLIQKALRGSLNEAEKQAFHAKLARDPALRDIFETEKALEAALQLLPNAPVATNFTTRVLEEARAADRETLSTPPFGWFQFRFARVAAGLAIVTLSAFLGLRQYRDAQRTAIAESVIAFSGVADVIASQKSPPAAVFQDFDAIQRLSLPREPEMDMELLFALQK